MILTVPTLDDGIDPHNEGIKGDRIIGKATDEKVKIGE